MLHRVGVVEAEAAGIERKANARIDEASRLVRALKELARTCGGFMKRYRGLPRLPTGALVSDWRAMLEGAQKAEERVTPFLAEHGAAHADPDELRALSEFFAWVPRHVGDLERIYAEVQDATSAFIAEHQLAGLIEEAKAQAQSVFGDKGTPTVELEVDPEYGTKHLFVVVETELDVDASEGLFSGLEEWWVGRKPAGAPLSLTVRHA